MRAEYKIIGYQLAFVVVAALVVNSMYPDMFSLRGLLYGGFVSVFTSAIMAYRIAQAAKKAELGSEKSSLYVYLGAIERLCVAIVLFGLGFMWLNLNPLPIVIGLMAGQVGFMIGAFKVKD